MTTIETRELYKNEDLTTMQTVATDIKQIITNLKNQEEQKEVETVVNTILTIIEEDGNISKRDLTNILKDMVNVIQAIERN